MKNSKLANSIIIQYITMNLFTMQYSMAGKAKFEKADEWNVLMREWYEFSAEWY